MVFFSLNLTGERKKKETACMICEVWLVVGLLLFDNMDKIRRKQPFVVFFDAFVDRGSRKRQNHNNNN